ncbi:hypothetical protein F751_5768 [Auxenochlorella protothecoides]|uniref:Uncharacterized protein n=1 Tax=Auxenochlorella protothecoides TaxID=3075 RepID=A0A087SUC6_AUXPR|nr:hypothetical protein F751_5768 [Auxenochlorella protothecoides]KFM29330.1 hypothetical protein F751_5768 [Auxenochlorella protothecoides]
MNFYNTGGRPATFDPFDDPRGFRKRPKSIFVRHSGKLSGLAVLFLTATVIYLHSHRRTLHSHLAAKDYQLNAIVEEKEAISRTLREKDHKVSVKTVESEHLRRTIERLQEEVSTQSTRALEATRLAEETTRASAAKIKALEERLQADTARYTSQEVPAVPVPAVPVPATPLTVPATPLTVPATHDEAGAGEVPLPGATTGTPAGAGLAASALPVTLGQSAGLPAGPTEPNPFVARAGGAHMARHHHRLSMLETAMGHERREGEEEPQEDPFAKLP